MGYAPITRSIPEIIVAEVGNSLLDFVMALVRDPHAAAQYAADPAGALAAAGLPGVTVADVQNLMPVVKDSLASATPSFGEAFDAASVWTSGAAAAALDAFHAPHPASVVDDSLPQVGVAPVVVPPVDPAPNAAATEPLVGQGFTPDQAVAGPLDELPVGPVDGDWAGDGSGWHQPQFPEPGLPPADNPGFDLF